MKRPLCITLLFLCAGIVTGMYASQSVVVGVGLVAVLCLGMGFYHKSVVPVLFVVAYLLGYRGLVRAVTPTDPALHSHVLAGETVVVTGMVHSYNYTRNARQRIELRMGGRGLGTANGNRAENENAHSQGGVIVTSTGEHLPSTGRIQAILPHGVAVQVGQSVSLTGRLNPLNPPSMPGGFNQQRFLGARGIDYTMFPRTVIAGEVTPSLNTWLQALRGRVLAVFEETLPTEQAAVMQSMVMGDRQNMDDELLDAFRGAGLYHILVVSGLHLSILMLSVTWALGKLFSQRVSGVLGLGFIVLYALMIGGVSVTRASLMAGSVVFGRLLVRRRDFVTSIAFAAMLILLHSPLFLFDAGFLLSFGSVLGIGLGSVPVERMLSRALGCNQLTTRALKYPKTLSAFATSIAVSLTLMPLFAWFFFRTMTYSLLAGIVVMATGNIVVILGFVAGVVGLVAMPVAMFLSGGLYFLASLYIWVARSVYALPHALWWTGRPSLAVVALYYVALLCLFALWHKPRESGHWLKFASAMSLGVFAVASLVWQLYPRGMSVTFLEQNRSPVAVVSVAGQHYLVSERNRPDQGFGNIARYLDYRNIRHVTPVSRIQFDYLGNDFDIGATSAWVNGTRIDMQNTAYRLHSRQGQLLLRTIGN